MQSSERLGLDAIKCPQTPNDSTSGDDTDTDCASTARYLELVRYCWLLRLSAVTLLRSKGGGHYR